MTTLSLENIKALFEARKLKTEMQIETNQVMAFLEHEKHQFPLFARIYEKSNLLQILTFFPIECKQKSIPDMGRLLHLFNRELDVPGFGMDENSRTVFFRCMIPSKDNKIDEPLIDAYLQATQLACQTFFKPIAALALGATTFNDLMAKAEKQK